MLKVEQTKGGVLKFQQTNNPLATKKNKGTEIKECFFKFWIQTEFQAITLILLLLLLLLFDIFFKNNYLRVKFFDTLLDVLTRNIPALQENEADCSEVLNPTFKEMFNAAILAAPLKSLDVAQGNSVKKRKQKGVLLFATGAQRKY